MAYALSINEIQHVKEQIHDELVAKAYLLDDAMFGDLGFKVTTDVENIDVCRIFNRKGLVARPYRVGNVKPSQLAKILENPVQVKPYYIKSEDSIERYREKGPYNVVDGSGESAMSQQNMREVAGRAGEDVRFNVWFGNTDNRDLEDTPENQVKLGLSLFDGIYTLIAKARTDGTISVANRNLIETGDITGLEADQVYDLLVNFYTKLHPALKKPEQTTYIYASDEFCRKAVKGYMITFPQISPTVLQSGWKFAEMPNIVLKTSAGMGVGGQLIASIEGNLEFVCDTREGTAQVRIGQTNEDLTIIGYQINAAAATRIREYSPEVFACNDAVNSYDWTPGQYIADIFTAKSADETKGTVAITSGTKDLYTDGDIIQLTATPKSGFEFVGWSKGGQIISQSNPFNFTFGGGVTNIAGVFKAEAAAEEEDETPTPTPTPTYTAVANPTGNPAEQGWYEKSGDVYSLTEDTTVVEGKTYYTKD